MSVEKFSEDCPGCRPALFDSKTGKRLAPDSPEMLAVNAIWAETVKQEREAFHRVTCQNSRAPSDMRLVQGIIDQIKAALHGLDQKRSRDAGGGAA